MTWAKRVADIVTHDLKHWHQTGVVWRLGGIHVALCVTIILIVWPGTLRITALSPLNIFKPYLLTELLILPYFGLMLGSETFPRHNDNRIAPHDWVLHEVASVRQVMVAKFTAIGCAITFLGVTTLPLNVLAISSTAFASGIWHLAWLVVAVETTWMTSLGTMIRVMQGGDRSRSVVAEVIYVIGLAVLILWAMYGAGHFTSVLNPIVILMRLIDTESVLSGSTTQAFLFVVSRIFLIAVTLISTYFPFHNSTTPATKKGVTA